MKPEKTNGGPIAAGRFVLHIGSSDGDLVNRSPQEELVQPRLRPDPIRLLPPSFPDLLDREREAGRALAALGAPGPGWVEFSGPPGVGKTALLRYLAHHPIASGFRDGILYLAVKQQPLEDLFQSLFEAFYECPEPIQADEAQIQQVLQDRQALILLDDCELSHRDLDSLLETAASCSFLIASTQRRLEEGGGGESIPLPGLPGGAALALFERESGRILTPPERHAARELCAGLEGRPVYIQRAAALACENQRSIAALAGEILADPAPIQALAGQVLASLSEEERRIVFALAVLGEGSISAGHLASLAGLHVLLPRLDRLERLGVVQAEGDRYALAAGLQEPVLNTWDLSEWMDHGLDYFLDWAEAQQRNPERLLEETGPLLHWLERAAGLGRWNEALRLARALEGPAARGCRWGTWRQALQMGLEAAQALGGRATEAWTLHQMGTRALCMGNSAEARSCLIRALQIRETLGDRSGAAVTRHNLGFLIDPRPARQSGQLPGKPRAKSENQPAPLPAAESVGRRAGRIAARMAGRSAPPPPTNLSRRAYAQAGRFHSFGGFVILLIALLLVVPMGTMLFGYTRYRSWSVANALPTGEGAPAGLGSQPSSTDTPTPLLPDTGKFTLTPTRPEVHFTPVSPAPSATPTPTPGSCGPPEGWVPYIVQRRDTLATIAKASGISAQQLMFANCLNGISWLTPGEVILVPRLPPALVAVTRTAAGSVTPSSSLTATASITPAATTTSTSTALSPGPIQLGQGRQTGTPPAGSPAEEPAAPAPSSASPTPTPTPTEPALPDLVVTEWEFGSQLAVNARGELIMPARVVVTNQGQGIAGDFKVAIQYDDRTSGASRQERFLAFEATSRTDPFYPHSIVPLAPNSSLAFEGNIRIGPELFGKTIYLWSVADSCAEEESSAEHCHVQESDEDNNGSQLILVLLPVSAGGTLQATVTSESAGATPVALPSIFRIRP